MNRTLSRHALFKGVELDRYADSKQELINIEVPEKKYRVTIDRRGRVCTINHEDGSSDKIHFDSMTRKSLAKAIFDHYIPKTGRFDFNEHYLPHLKIQLATMEHIESFYRFFDDD